MQITHPVEALLFDMGGIVIDVDFDRVFHSWESLSRLSFEEIRSRFSMDAAYGQHERGEIDASQYFQHLRTLLELEGSDEEITAGWNEIYVREITETLNDILSIKDQFPCYAFTNTNPTHQTAWLATFPRVVAAFERVFVSSELGLRKPERAAFDAVAAAIGVKASGILFFDDAVENVRGAGSRSAKRSCAVTSRCQKGLGWPQSPLTS